MFQSMQCSGMVMAESIQTLDRAVAILRVLADDHRQGVRLTDVAARTGLSKSTAHRILVALVKPGLAEQDAGSGHFFPGLALLGLGAAAANRHDLAELAAPYLQRLADRTGETVYLSMRRGNDVVCIDRVEGPFPIKILTWKAGDRRPLGVNASGLALLALLPDAESVRIVEANAAQVESYTGNDRAGVLELIERARRNSYAFNEGVLRSGHGGCRGGDPWAARRAARRAECRRDHRAPGRGPARDGGPLAEGGGCQPRRTSPGRDQRPQRASSAPSPITLSSVAVASGCASASRLPPGNQAWISSPMTATTALNPRAIC
jgi:DNA-binding IclR family transcriptional regulator